MWIYQKLFVYDISVCNRKKIAVFLRLQYFLEFTALGMAKDKTPNSHFVKWRIDVSVLIHFPNEW